MKYLEDGQFLHTTMCPQGGIHVLSISLLSMINHFAPIVSAQADDKYYNIVYI